MRRPKINLLFLTFILTFLGCTPTVQENYSVVKIDTDNEIKFSVQVRIDRILSEDELKNIALNVKSDIKAKSKKGYVFFLLPEMETDNGAWASVEFQPEISVNIFGPTIEDNQKINSSIKREIRSLSDKRFIGIWIDNSLGEIALIGIRKDKQEGYIKEYIDPTTFEVAIITFLLNKVKKNGVTIFKEKESFSGDYYIIEKNGDLSSYDNQGYIATYRRKM
jgi:methyltransferase-like protein